MSDGCRAARPICSDRGSHQGRRCTDEHRAIDPEARRWDIVEAARRLVRDCYDAGVDALIVQDMGLLELDLPPIDLHASTQCDIRTPAKARFLADVGFSQIVLARELTLSEIAAVRARYEYYRERGDRISQAE